jgi:hypothetical protein
MSHTQGVQSHFTGQADEPQIPVNVLHKGSFTSEADEPQTPVNVSHKEPSPTLLGKQMSPARHCTDGKPRVWCKVMSD